MSLIAAVLVVHRIAGECVLDGATGIVSVTMQRGETATRDGVCI